MGRRASRYLLLTSISFYLIAVANDRLSMYLLCWLTVSLQVVAWTSARLAAHGLTVTRRATGTRLAAGEPLPIRLAVTNRGSLPKGDLVVHDEAVNRTRPRRERHSLLIPRLPGTTTAEVDTTAGVARRGRWSLGPVSLLIGDPFGLCERSWTVPGTEHELLVHPATVPLAAFTPGRNRPGEGQRSTPSPDGFDLRFVRPYLVGDDLRHVDWKATAHTGRLHIREYETPAAQDAAVVLDLSAAQVFGRGEHDSLETAVTVAASLAVRLLELGHRTRLVAHEGGLIDVVGEPGEGGRRALLDRLASVAGEGRVSCLALLQQQADRLAEGAVTMVVTASADPVLAAWLARSPLRRRGLQVIALDGAAFSGEPAAGPGVGVFSAARLPCRVLRPGDDLAAVLGAAEVAA